MPNSARRADLAGLAEYSVLLSRVRQTFVLGQQKAEQLKVQTSLLVPKRGIPGLYRVAADGGGCAVDLGFTSYQALPSALRKDLKPGDLVRVSSDGQPSLAADATEAGLYTYDVEILQVVDGDTLWLKIWLKPSHWLKEKVRLRSLDCPELDTPEGKIAKRFVEGLASQAVSVTIVTTKPDKWDRYLSDVFLRRKNGGELFLNNLLLENGHARPYTKVALGDWEGE